MDDWESISAGIVPRAETGIDIRRVAAPVNGVVQRSDANFACSLSGWAPAQHDPRMNRPTGQAYVIYRRALTIAEPALRYLPASLGIR